jgi:hypothetical protein
MIFHNEEIDGVCRSCNIVRKVKSWSVIFGKATNIYIYIYILLWGKLFYEDRESDGNVASSSWSVV